MLYCFADCALETHLIRCARCGPAWAIMGRRSALSRRSAATGIGLWRTWSSCLRPCPPLRFHSRRPPPRSPHCQREPASVPARPANIPIRRMPPFVESLETVSSAVLALRD
jgi:hypothetical protein